MAFPQRANINEEVSKTILSRAGQNQLVSNLMPWIKITSCRHEFLSLESTPQKDSYQSRYGGKSGRSGRIGVNKNGNDVFASELLNSDGDAIIEDRSLRSSPSIDSVAVTQGNEGLSKKVNFTINAFSLGQAEALIQYFLEPATNVLVEWGFALPESVTQKTPITPCDIADYNNIKHITKKRKDSKGTYDALLGIVTGGQMSFGDNESYSIEVELTSVGEIPAYLQHHKNVRVSNSSSNINNSSDKFAMDEIEDDADEESTIGKGLFKQMYNDLPAHKRTAAVKNLVFQSWATNQGNFVNMDKEIRDDLIEAIKDTELHGKEKAADGGDLTIPTDTPLFDSNRYIRAGLAFTILDLSHNNESLKPVRVGCRNVSTPNPNINWRNTICRAFKNIYSADGSILMIPNPKTPDFALQNALTADPEFKNPIRKNGKEIVTVDARPVGFEDEHQKFPRSEGIEYEGMKSLDSDYECISYLKDEWGYLKDLFIDFDFFCECIESSGLFTKDVYFKILNGLSSAVNMIWDFQIVETAKIPKSSNTVDTADGCIEYWENRCKEQTDGDTELAIVCFHSTGNKNTLGKTKFQSRGIKSPFITAELNMDIPAAMKGQIIGQKNSSKNKNVNTEQKEKDFTGIFTSYEDAVQAKLNPLIDAEFEERKRQQEEEDEFNRLDRNNDGKITPSEKNIANRQQRNKNRREKKENEEKQRKSNYEFFADLATVVPKIQDRNADLDLAAGFWDWNSSNNVNLEDLALVVSWDDTNLLKNVQEFNAGRLDDISTKEESEKNAIILPIKFNFTIHGVSGLKVGDTFNITDLPGNYKKKIFQVTQISHNVEQSIWKTSVEGALVPIDAAQDE